MDDPTLLILFLITAGTQAIFVFAGWLVLKFPPNSPNHFYGYRTKRSMMNIENWRKGNRFAGEIMMKLGLWCMIISVVLWFVTDRQNMWIVWMILSSILIALITLVKTEQFLKEG